MYNRAGWFHLGPKEPVGKVGHNNFEPLYMFIFLFCTCTIFTRPFLQKNLQTFITFLFMKRFSRFRYSNESEFHQKHNGKGFRLIQKYLRKQKLPHTKKIYFYSQTNSYEGIFLNAILLNETGVPNIANSPSALIPISSSLSRYVIFADSQRFTVAETFKNICI